VRLKSCSCTGKGRAMYSSASDDHNRYWPECYRYLSGLEEEQLYYAAYERRHPLAAYNSSIRDLQRSLARVFRSMDAVPKLSELDITGNEAGDILTDYRSFLYQLSEHIEDCQKIATCLFPSLAVRDKDHRYKRFAVNHRVCGDLARRVVNAIKHAQNELLPVLLSFSGAYALGYSCAAPNGRNGIGPNPNVHKKYRGHYTGFSLNADIRRNFSVIYEIGKILSDFLVEMGAQPSLPQKPAEDMLELAGKVASLSAIYFPDEVEKPIPEIAVVSGSTLSVSYPGTIGKGFFFPRGAHIAGAFSGDGKTNQFALLYFNESTTKPVLRSGPSRK